MLPQVPPVQQDPDKLRVFPKPSSLPRSSDSPTIHLITRPDPWVLSLPPPTLSYPQPSAPGSIPPTRCPLTLSSSSPSSPPRDLSTALSSPAWTLGVQSAPVWSQRGLSIPRADLLCSSPPWLPSVPGQHPRPSIQHPGACVIRSHLCPLGCLSAALAWLAQDRLILGTTSPGLGVT